MLGPGDKETHTDLTDSSLMRKTPREGNEEGGDIRWQLLGRGKERLGGGRVFGLRKNKAPRWKVFGVRFWGSLFF